MNSYAQKAAGSIQQEQMRGKKKLCRDQTGKNNNRFD